MNPFAAAALPSTEALKEAYILTELSKIATAENAKLTAVEVTKRLDSIIEIFKEKSK